MKRLSPLFLLLLAACSQPDYSFKTTKLSDAYIAFTVAGVRDSLGHYEVSGDPAHNTLGGNYQPGVTWLSFGGMSVDGQESVSITIPNFVDTGIYQLSAHHAEGTHAGLMFAMDSTVPGYVHITKFDTAARVLSGTFHLAGRYLLTSNAISIDTGVLDRVPFN